MNKGINTMIASAKEELASKINELLQQGIPPVVVSMMLEGLYNEVENLVDKVCTQEVEQYKKSLKENVEQEAINDGQVLHEDVVEPQEVA